MRKRALDIFCSALALVTLAPIIACLALLVRCKLGSPVIFSQLRPGSDCQPFCMYKFRTMTDKRDKDGYLLPDSDRLHPIGKFLRSTSLDELPGLWNVLKGDLSLVGPRPLLMEYLPLYTPEQARRHAVKPGLTGWAQVNGRNALSWEEKFALDIWYIDHKCFFLDMRILWLTVVKVLKREGISESGEATMSRFEGSNR